MDMHIGEMNSTVRVTDSQALVSPQVLDRIMQVLLVQLREQEATKRRLRADTRISNKPAAAADESWS